jgi:peptidoglycan/xylan/chitin deacetylase (PgdA/CDA1 family)
MTHKPTPARSAPPEAPPASSLAAAPAGRRPSLSLTLLPVLLIVAGLALLLAGQARSGADEKAGPATLAPAAGAVEPGAGWAAAPTAAAATVAPTAQGMAAAPSAQSTPAAASQSLEAYCLWPNDTLGLIAQNAGVSEAAILAANPGWTGHAGAAIRLPAGSVPPAQWTSPLPAVTRVEDLPFGVSGYYLGRDNRQKRVALSFDVGYAEGNKALKETLAARGIRATFFVLGGALVKHSYIVDQILDNGHELGNHSYTHDNMLYMPAEMVRWELATTEQLAQQARPGATTRPLFRAPFGAINDTVLGVTNSEGYHVIGWTVDSRDWTDNITADAIYQRVTEHVCPGAIIAFHDVNPANAGALPRLLDYLESNGYQFVTVSEILAP